jgi:hypothetical protein
VIGEPPPLPTIDELEAMPFADAVRAVIAAVNYCLSGFEHRARVRQSQARSLSAADLQAIANLTMALEALKIDVRELLEPGTTIRALHAAFAALTDGQVSN